MDHVGDSVSENAPNNFYVPTKSKEQLQQEQAQRELNAAQMPLIVELIEDFQKFYDEARDVDSIQLGTNVKLESQIIASKTIRKWCETKLKSYQSKYKVAVDSLAAGVEEAAQ